MEKWGAGSFENGIALDWLMELIDGLDADPLVEALLAVTDLSQDVPRVDGCKAIAAAELVAALNPCSKMMLPDEVTQWLRGQKIRPTRKLVSLARKAVEEVGSETSELHHEWIGEARGGKEWVRLVAHLKGQLEYDAPDEGFGPKSWWRFWG